MNVRKLIIAFLIGVSLYLLVNWVSVEGITPAPVPCNRDRGHKHWYSGLTYKHPDIDVSALDLDAKKHGYIRYYASNVEIIKNGVPVDYKWYRENSSKQSEEVEDKYIQSILSCLYWKYNIKSISVRKETCHRLIGGGSLWKEFNYILNVFGSSNDGGNADFTWAYGKHDTLEYNAKEEREMCYNATGQIKTITAL